MADGHQFTWHGTGQDLLAAMLNAIAEAKTSVILETFVFRESPIGDRFRAALTAAARRGVRVRVLADAFGSFGLRRDYFDELAAAGGAMRWFNELRWASFSFRDHRKLLVVDNAVAVSGGCNISSEYDGDGISNGWRDGGVCIRGPISEALAAEFDRQWERASRQRWQLPARGGASQRAGNVEALFIKPGFGRNPLRDALRRDLAAARDVAITSAYFLPAHRLRRLLAGTVVRGARVRILLAGKTDVPSIQLASRSLYRRLISRGIEIWEYQPQILHAKLIIVDDTVYVGSSNLDPRSMRINFEIMLRINNAGLAAAARKQFEADLAERALPVTLATLRYDSSWWRRLQQRMAYWLFARLDTEVAALKLQAWRSRFRRKPASGREDQGERGF
jgi:cardiolipin synthase